MRVGVLSDTHGYTGKAARALHCMGKIDALIHAGDFYVDALYLKSQADVPIHAVVGNCDSPSMGPEELILTFEGHHIYVAHGHLLRVRYGMQGLFYKARENGAMAVVFGHTHMPLNIREDGVLFFNPGSTSIPHPGHKASYGILEIDAGGVRGEIYSL